MTLDSSGPGPVDVCSWIGGYPFREIPHPEAAILARVVLPREGFSGAWVGHLPGAFQRDPASSNEALLKSIESYRDILEPAPIVRPDWPGWLATLTWAVEHGAPAVRIYPAQWGMVAENPRLRELALACGELGLALHVTVRFEDLRQRHFMDVASDVSAALLRGIARIPGSRCHLVVSGAGRELIEETHWGLTPEEQSRVWYDFNWLWGPPEDSFAHLVRTLGAPRLTWSSYWPLRLAQQCRSLTTLLPDDLLANGAVESLADGRIIASSARSAGVAGSATSNRQDV